MRMRGLQIIAVVGLVALAVAGTARAHPLVDRAVAAYEDAEFERALEAFDEAEEATDLRLADLEQLLRVRSLLHFAMGSEDLMRRDIVRLISISPDFEADATLPPPVREAIALAKEKSSGPIAITTVRERVPGGLRVATRLTGDRGGLVERVMVRARVNEEPWVGAEDKVELPASPGATVSYYAWAVGPGGVEIASEGAEKDPVIAPVSTFQEATEEPVSIEVGAGATSAEADDDSLSWVVVGGIAAGVIAVTLAVLVIALSGGSEETQFGPPILD